MNQHTRKPLLALLLLGMAAGPLQAQSAAQPLPEHLVQALDRFLIHEVQTRYALAHDQTEPDAYAAVFTDAAEIHGGNGLIAKGTAAIREMGAGNRARLNPAEKEGEQWLISRRKIIMDMSNDAVMASLWL